MSDFCTMPGPLYFDEGWDFMQKGIKNLIESLPNPHFTAEDNMMLYTNVYNMCVQKYPHRHCYSPQLYEKYKETFEDYIRSTVLPSLRGKKDELLLRELLNIWSNYKIMTKYMLRFFGYLDMYYIPYHDELPSLEVYDEMHKEVMDAILAMIVRKRAAEAIDENLINNALAFYSEIAERTRKNEPKHFVETMLKGNAIMEGASN